MRSGKATLRDVAEQAGVNTATASVVLNGSRSGTGVSTATRQRIMDSARELRYQPNAVARSLKRSRTNIVGFYLGHGISVDDPFFVDIHKGLEAGCQKAGQHLLIYSSRNSDSLDAVYAELTNGIVSGLILYTRPDDPLARRLAESHLPVIAIADPIPNVPSVTGDNVGGARLQAEYLAAKGHRRIMYRNALHSFASVTVRYEAFCAAASGLGMTVLETHSERGGGASAEELDVLALPAAQRPTAAVCWNDFFAYDLLLHCDKQRIDVPQDLAVVGFDGLRVSFARTSWDLTTVRVPWSGIAATAVTLLTNALEGKDVPLETVMPVSLFAGRTA